MNKFVNLPDEVNSVTSLVLKLITPEECNREITESDLIACISNSNGELTESDIIACISNSNGELTESDLIACISNSNGELTESDIIACISNSSTTNDSSNATLVTDFLKIYSKKGRQIKIVVKLMKLLGRLTVKI